LDFIGGVEYMRLDLFIDIMHLTSIELSNKWYTQQQILHPYNRVLAIDFMTVNQL